ncbi:MAG: DinB family protein [Planctomycetes bacterium]|nr:DinB family protein [Planctomycetota bacterium]
MIIERYRRWFEYEKDAHAKVFASFDTVPSDRRDSAEYRRAVAIMAHIVAARRMWLYRLGAIATAPALFPVNPELANVVAEWREAQGDWEGLLASQTDQEIERTFEYKSLDAGRFRNHVEDILAQLFGHSWYHRGQIAMLIRAAGGEPAVTDLIFWCRESCG